MPLPLPPGLAGGPACTWRPIGGTEGDAVGCQDGHRGGLGPLHQVHHAASQKPLLGVADLLQVLHQGRRRLGVATVQPFGHQETDDLAQVAGGLLLAQDAGTLGGEAGGQLLGQVVEVDLEVLGDELELRALAQYGRGVRSLWRRSPGAPG